METIDSIQVLVVLVVIFKCSMWEDIVVPMPVQSVKSRKHVLKAVVSCDCYPDGNLHSFCCASLQTPCEPNCCLASAQPVMCKL
jgi:hypothetical protein